MIARCILAGLVCAGLLFGSTAAAREPDWTDYDLLLKRYVSRGTLAGVDLNQVDYAGLGADPAFAALVERVALFPIAELEGAEETLAFYINVYNILALKMVIDNLPLESIKDVGNLFKPVWKRPAGTIAGKTVTLDEIEHERLRKMNDPRMHMAIVCASVSCPDLRMEAYRASKLDSQLDAQTTAFLNNTGKGLRVGDDGVQVSRIFKWFAGDFDALGGVGAFIRRYHPLPEKLTIAPVIDYNWSLNGR